MDRSRALSICSVVLLGAGALWGVWALAFIMTAFRPVPPFAARLLPGIMQEVEGEATEKFFIDSPSIDVDIDATTFSEVLEITDAVVRERFGSPEGLRAYSARFDIIAAIITIVLGIGGLRLSRIIRNKPPGTMKTA